jgi:hypothetical protein
MDEKHPMRVHRAKDAAYVIENAEEQISDEVQKPTRTLFIATKRMN